MAGPLPSAAAAGALHSSLPRCVDSETDIARIQAIQKASSKSPSKYDGYRSTLRADTGLELAARLAYAETLAANCPANQPEVLDLVASVIGNRIRIRRGDIASVVFQRDQFASSLNVYAESRYRDFLCPKDRDLWSEAVRKTRANLEGPEPGAAVAPDAVNYYLYRHSQRFKAPDWGLEEMLVADGRVRECIRVFRNGGWK